MTATTAPLPRCWDCAGPCLTYKGSVHGWRCTACLDRYLAAAAARADAKEQRDRDRLARKMLRVNGFKPTDTADRRRGGGLVDTFRTAPALDFYRKDIA
ncbi:hypothetical protein [Mycolicibacterium sp. CR10]|uniref:hypothetical protein n=1 Tax=Mycolicibacterium sp. CR10 TaxID=2562314 RepID=UPI0010C12926|nr:hypothetical protein [Mycolicibacterium sp. CR10]